MDIEQDHISQDLRDALTILASVGYQHADQLSDNPAGFSDVAEAQRINKAAALLESQMHLLRIAR
jgi:hypothetical protein